MSQELAMMNGETEQLEEPPELDEEVARTLKTIIDEFDKEDSSARSKIVQLAAKLDLLWQGEHNVYWSEAQKDYLNLSSQDLKELEVDEEAKIVNIYKANIESVVAALGAGIPHIRYFPEDADNPADIVAAKAYSKIGDLLYLHNEIELLILKALRIFYNSQFVAAYNHHVYDKAYGVRKEDVIENQPVTYFNKECSNCGSPTSMYDEEPSMQPEMCENCGAIQQPNNIPQDDEIPVRTGERESPYGREIIEIFGPLQVKIPSWAQTQEQIPYVILEREEHITRMQHLFPAFREKLGSKSSSKDPDERILEEHEAETVRVKLTWLRPWAYNKEADETRRAALINEFPNGTYTIQVNDVMVSATDEAMDDHWTFSMSPLDDKIHATPPGKALIGLQEMENELINIILETIEQGILETFADPQVLSFPDYEQTSKEVGQTFPAKPKPGQSLGNSFYQSKGAMLSGEVRPFQDRLKEYEQFMIGAFPSIFGGTGEGSKTLGEYKESRNQALQRLSTYWKIFASFFARVMAKSIKSFIEHIDEDMKYAVSHGQNDFVNIWIKQEELEGKVGRVVADSSDKYPVSWVAKRSLVMDMLGLGNEQINMALFHPENSQWLQSVLGATDFYIPGVDDRNKQLIEISKLLQGQVQIDEEKGIPASSIPAETEIDNNAVHAETVKAWAVSIVGIETRQANPMGYMNVMAHYAQHMLALMQETPPEEEKVEEEENAEETE